MFSRRKIAALVAEFLGTGILSFAVLTVSRSQIGIPYFVSFAAGLVVLLFGVVLGRDVQLNPAYTLGLWTARRIKTLKAVAFIVVQLLGGIAAYGLYKYFAQNNPIQPFPTAFKGTILVAEAFGTFVFAFAAAGALYRQGNQLVRNFATAIGYSVGVIVASVAAAGFINPAVALASNALAWGTYMLGPVLGAIIGVNLYSLLFADRVRGAKVVKSAKPAVATTSSDVETEDDERDELNDEAIEVSPASVADRSLEKAGKAEKSAKNDKKADKAKRKKSKK